MPDERTSALPRRETKDDAPPSRVGGRRALRRLQGDRGARFAVLWLIVLGLAAIASPLLPIPDANEQNIRDRLMPPPWMSGGSLGHPLGTDQLGRDILSRTLAGARVSLLVGLASVFVAGTAGVSVGLYSGYVRSVLGKVLDRIADVQISFPLIVFAIAIAAVLGPSVVNLIAILGLYGWVTYARVTRAETMSIREREYIEAARASGVSTPLIMLHHVLPNVSSSVLFIAPGSVAQMIIAESSLSFLGLGVPATAASWGSIIADGRSHVERAWWLTIFPGIALMLTVLALNVLATTLRDAFDPTVTE